MQINIPMPNLKNIDGYKTYITLAMGAAIIAANHFGVLPNQFVPKNANGYPLLDPNAWLIDEWNLLLAACARSAWAKHLNKTGVGLIAAPPAQR